MDCIKHDEVIDKQNKLENKLTALEQSVSGGWKIINKNTARIETLETKSNDGGSDIKLLQSSIDSLTKAVIALDEKLDKYIHETRQETKEIRAEQKELSNKIYEIEKNAAVTNNKLEWNWKTISAIGMVLYFILQSVLSNLL